VEEDETGKFKVGRARLAHPAKKTAGVQFIIASHDSTSQARMSLDPDLHGGFPVRDETDRKPLASQGWLCHFVYRKVGKVRFSN